MKNIDGVIALFARAAIFVAVSHKMNKLTPKYTLNEMIAYRKCKPANNNWARKVPPLTGNSDVGNSWNLNALSKLSKNIFRPTTDVLSTL